MNVLKRLRKDKLAILCITILLFIVLLGIFAPVLSPNDPLQVDVKNKFAAPSAEYPFGTDNLGRCSLSRLLFGIRTTLGYSLVTMLATVSIGTFVGLFAGFSGGRMDQAIMSLCNVLLSFPSEIMILAIVGALGPSLINVVIASIVSKWAWYARMTRTMILNYSEKNYVRFAKVSGCSGWHIMRRHLLRGALSEIVVLATLDMGFVILSISSLSFLGIGGQSSMPEWGMMLSEAKNIMLTHPTQMLPPGIAILTVVAVFNYLGDSLRDAMDPKYVYKTKGDWRNESA